MSYRAGFAGVVGLPNAGKSSLMNFLVSEKVSIVSSKPQTTRRRVLGIHSSEQGQIVFVDSPGVITAAAGLNAFIAKEANEVIKDSDALILVMSLDTGSKDEAKTLVELVKKSSRPWIGVITKTDLKDKAHRQLILREMMESHGAKKVYNLSLLKENKSHKEEKEELLKEVLNLLPESPAPLHDVELFTPENLRNLASEVVREKCFEFLHEELPFQVAVRPVLFDEDHPQCPQLAYEILVAKENHKAIVIGKAGQNLKKIGTEARKEIEKLMGEKIFLGLKVSYRKDWYKDAKIMKELGYYHDSKD